MNRRRLPDWLSKSPEKNTKNIKCENNGNFEILLSEEEKIENISINSNNENISLEKPPTKISPNHKSEKLIKNLTINESNQSTRILRSCASTKFETEHKLKPSEYPFIEYKGEIKCFIDMIDIACTCDELIKWVELQQKTIVPIAFDMEWPFSFQTGPGKTALIQLCAEENVCYLFHIFHLKKLPAVLVALLSHPKVRLHGVNIKNDLRKLQRDFPNVKVECMLEQCVDLGTWCNQVCNTGGRWSLERLVSYICKLRINKDKKVRMSKWHIIPLNDSQKLYAAIDVYISQVIYKELEKREKEKEKFTQEFVENFGEEALAVVRSLGENFI